MGALYVPQVWECTCIFNIFHTHPQVLGPCMCGDVPVCGLRLRRAAGVRREECGAELCPPLWWLVWELPVSWLPMRWR